MRILVTGGGGYVGSTLVPALLTEGHEVVVVDNFMYNQTSLLDCCHNDKLTIIRGDARERQLISDALRGCDAIVPLACLTGAPRCAQDPVGAQTVNYDAIEMILDVRSRGQIVIFPTTNSGYGVGQDGLYCTEETPMNPISLYARLKVEIERLILEAGDCITLRLATAFGIAPRMRLDLLVNDFTYRAVNDRFIILFESHFKRNFIHVRDVAKAFIHCLKHFDTMRDQPYNVGLSDANLSKWELCEEIKKQVAGFYFIEADVGEDSDKRNYIVSNSKIESTGFEPDISIQKGIADLIRGFQIVRRNEFSNI